MTETSETASVEKASFWLRLIPMIILAISLWLALHVLFLVAAIQFIWVAINDEPNENLLRFGDSLSKWMRDTAAFLSYKTEDKPFPWKGWPEGEGETEVELSDEPVAQPEPETDTKPKPKTPRKRTTKPKS